MERLEEKWSEDIEQITKESLDNIEKRREIAYSMDDNIIEKELLYQHYNVKIINEVLAYFKEHGLGYDYQRLIQEDYDKDIEDADNMAGNDKNRDSNQMENRSTGDSVS
jgi:hypothetical protein